MRVWIGMALLWLSLPAFAAAAQPPYRSLLGRIIRAHCQNDVCTWFSIETSAPAGESRVGTLLRVTVKDWTSVHPDGSYNLIANRKLVGTIDEYFFCSRTKPAVIYKTEDRPGWFAYRLSPDLPHRTGTSEALYARYWAACHGITVDDSRSPSLATAMGYHTEPDTKSQEQQLDAPEDVLRW